MRIFKQFTVRGALSMSLGLARVSAQKSGQGGSRVRIAQTSPGRVSWGQIGRVERDESNRLRDLRAWE